jgi:hypothetical protein
MSTFTVGVFQDVAWAQRGVAALLGDGFAPESLTLLAKESPETARLIEQHLGADAQRLDLKTVGPTVGRGPLLAALQGDDAALSAEGLAATFRRAGFQAHDGYIYETLTSRGGVLVAVHNEPRAADALAKLHAYGAGNAAIGAWKGRV